jgi:chromosome segregation ATPase
LDWGKLLAVPILSTLLGVAGAFVTMQISVGRLQERMDNLKTEVEGKANTTLMENALNRHLDEIGQLRTTKADALAVTNFMATANAELSNLRNQVGTLTANHSNLSVGYHQASGKYDTAINHHAADLATLRSEVALLNKAVASHESTLANQCSDVKHLKEVGYEKLGADLANLKERIAKLEAILSQKAPPAKD